MDPIISMLCLDAPSLPRAEELQSAWLQRWPRDKPLSVLTSAGTRHTYAVGKTNVVFALMPAPIPQPDLASASSNSSWWPEALETLAGHSQHIIVTVAGSDNILEAMKLLTKATIAFAAACNHVTGVYWSNSNQVHQPTSFINVATEQLRESLPIPLWVSVNIEEREGGRSSGRTSGMWAFDQLEFETLDAPEPAKELYDRPTGVAEYVIRNGPVIKNRQTFGESRTERIRLVHSPSQADPGTMVARLDYEKPSAVSGNDEEREPLTTWGRIHLSSTCLLTIAFGVWLYYAYPYLQGSWLRHVVLVGATLIVGATFLFATEQFFLRVFGLDTTRTEKRSAQTTDS